MDKSTQNPGKEYTATPVTAADMVKEATLVMDRVTGEMYDPKAKFDEMMNKPDIMGMLKRLSIR